MVDKPKKILKDKQFLAGVLFGVIIAIILSLFILIIIKKPQTDIIPVTEDVGYSLVETTSVTNLAINTFELKKDAVICKENDKPVVYMFSTASCPHCQWIMETFNSFAKEYSDKGQIMAYSYDVDTGDDLLTKEVENDLTSQANNVYNEFSPEGYIPVFAFGCKYFRIGNGYEGEDNLNKETAEFLAIINELIN